MEAKVISVTTQGTQPVVNVGFFNGKEKINDKNYYLDPGETIDSIKPKIKEDLDKTIEAVRQAEEAKERIDEVVDLEGIKSTSELEAEKKAQEEKDENTGSSDPNGFASNEPDNAIDNEE